MLSLMIYAGFEGSDHIPHESQKKPFYCLSLYTPSCIYLHIPALIFEQFEFRFVDLLLHIMFKIASLNG